MVIKILANLDHFTISGTDDYILSHGVGLSNNSGIKKEYFSDRLFLNAIGDLSNELLRQETYFACAIINYPEAPASINREIDDIKSYLKDSIFCLWFAKDNSVHIGDVFSQVVDGAKHSFTASSAATRVSNSHGEYEAADFSKDDMEYTQSIATQYRKLCDQGADDPAEEKAFMPGDGSIPTGAPLRAHHSHNDHNRIERAMNFLQSARVIDYLPYRISLYLPVLESLFGCGIASCSAQRVAERVAKYTGAEKTDRVDIFNTITQAYRLRDRYNHGEIINSDVLAQEIYKELSKSIDSITRKALTKIIMEDSPLFLKENAALDLYLNALVLG